MDSSAKYGLGVTTPNEMARLFELLANGKAVNPKADSAMLDILAHNQDFEKMQRYIVGPAVPHKTGATDPCAPSARCSRCSRASSRACSRRRTRTSAGWSTTRRR